MPVHQLLGALEHRLRGLRLGGLGAHLVGLVGERLGLVLGVHPLALAALLVGLALGEVRRPAHVVDVDLGPVGVEVEHLVDARLEQPDVVADHDQAALVRCAGTRAATRSSRRRGGWWARRGAASRRRRTGSGPARRGGAGRRTGCSAAGRAAGPRCRGWPRSARPRPRPRSRRRRAASASALLVAPHRRGRGRPGRRCPSRPRPRAAGVRRRRGRARTGSGRGRAPRGRRCAGPAAGSRPTPVRVTVPDAGSASPARILVSVVLPAPLRPTSPTLSPAATRKETSSISRRAPARTSSWWAVIMGAAFDVGSDVERTAHGRPTVPVGARPCPGLRRTCGGAARPSRATSLTRHCPARRTQMRFNPKARLDPGQVEGRGGAAAGSAAAAGRRPPGRHPRRRRHRRADPHGHPDRRVHRRSAAAATRAPTPGAGGGTDTSFEQCQTGADANKSQKCRLVAITNSVQAFWTDQFPKETGKPYVPIKTDSFTGRVHDRVRRRQLRRRAVLLPATTSGSTSTSPSSSRCSRASSAPRADRSPRRTWSRTSTATTSRTCSASWAGSARSRARTATRSGSS